MKKLTITLLLGILLGCSTKDFVKIVDQGGEVLAEVKVEIADDNISRQRGLMHRTKLKENSGMLFVFNREQILNFWMKNTYIPLDIAYISKDFQIIDIFTMVPLSTQSVESTGMAKYALEVNAGFFKKKNVKVGDFIEVERNN
ncbi:MAG: DUF192 domain-containing protein [Spirochaetales bacterium]|nr:DUF192 domain-containing protein [Spirochaetales bacterium]